MSYIVGSRFGDFNFETFLPITLEGAYKVESAYKFVLAMIADKNYRKLRYGHLSNDGIPSNINLFSEYIRMFREGQIQRDEKFEESVKMSKTRSASGVLVFTVVMSDKPLGQNFTCKWDCHYCPKQPNVARSYLLKEPAVARASASNWDPIASIRNRVMSYLTTGNMSIFSKEIVKGDIIIEGGTYTSYPEEYRRQFFRDIFYACNTIYDSVVRERLSLEEELEINKTVVGIRITGMSIETRPDTVNNQLCVELRQCGVTKVQLGVQSTFDVVLKKNNRGCSYSSVSKATRILSDNAFKIQIHMMPDLPGSNMDMDKQMFQDIFHDDEVLFDHMKVYPCMVVDYTEIKEWYLAGTYRPYGEDNEKLMEVLVDMIRSLNESERYDLRIERVIRDIPVQDIEGGTKNTSAGQELSTRCHALGFNSIDVRSREPTRSQKSLTDIILISRKHINADGENYFISVESQDSKTIYGLLRLRFPSKNENKFFPELSNCALIREVHVYDNAVSVGCSGGHGAQHQGFGTRMMKKAYAISKSRGFNKIAVISGVGVMEYYKKKHSFVEEGLYLTRSLDDIEISQPFELQVQLIGYNPSFIAKLEPVSTELVVSRN